MIKNIFFKKNIKQILIIYRDSSKGILQSLQKVEQHLKKKHIEVKSFPQSMLNQTVYETLQPDLALVLGGDGTYLQAVQFIPDEDIPFLGINMGSFGFLTVYRKQQILNCLDTVLEGKMQIEERSLLQITVRENAKQERLYKALNDMVIERGRFSHLINISITIQNQNIYSVKADGLIISSPTGSTAYNLASGGPILHPKVKAFAITPICSHSLTHRPVIIPETCSMHFQMNNQDQSGFLTIDGKKVEEINNQHTVTLKKSEKTHRTLREQGHNDFLLLKEKLKFSQ